MTKQLGDTQSPFNPIRIRVNGSGELQTFLFDTGQINNATLDPKTMSETSAQSINILSNFRAERACVLLMTTEKDEFFSVSNIWMYTKPTAQSFPQS